MALTDYTADDLRDADKREQFLAELAVATVGGLVKTKDANSARATCKEIRDNTDVRGMTREMEVYRAEIKRVLARKARLEIAEIQEIFRKAYQAAHDEDSDG